MGSEFKRLVIVYPGDQFRAEDFSLLKLKVRDVQNEKGRINEYITVKEQKTGKIKRFPINKTSQKAIREYLGSREYNPDAYLFESRKRLYEQCRFQEFRLTRLLIMPPVGLESRIQSAPTL